MIGKRARPFTRSSRCAPPASPAPAPAQDTRAWWNGRAGSPQAGLRPGYAGVYAYATLTLEGLGKRKAPACRGLLQAALATLAYLSEPLIELNLAFRLVPMPLTTAMIASEMPAAIRPYSIAVAPDSSFTKRANRFFITQLHVHVAVELYFGRAGVLSTVTMGSP